MKKDINFLQVKNQTEGKKGVSTVAVVSIVMIILIGLLGFLFGNTKTKINKANDHVLELEQLTQTSKFAKRDQEFQKVSSKLNSFLYDTVKKDEIKKNINFIKSISVGLFNDVYGACSDNDTPRVIIKHSNFDSYVGIIELSCEVIQDASIESLREVDYFLDRLSDSVYIEKCITNEDPYRNPTTKKIEFNVIITVKDLSQIVEEGE